MSEIRWLAAEELIQLNAWTVLQTGERHALLFPDMLESAMAKPKNHLACAASEDVFG